MLVLQWNIFVAVKYCFVYNISGNCKWKWFSGSVFCIHCHLALHQTAKLQSQFNDSRFYDNATVLYSICVNIQSCCSASRVDQKQTCISIMFDVSESRSCWMKLNKRWWWNTKTCVCVRTHARSIFKFCIYTTCFLNLFIL
jgi:hypothetical protein